MTFSGLFDTIAVGKEDSVLFFNNWNKHVKQTVPDDRLLVFEVKQGWEPLCKFLNLPIPEESFPHVNDTSSMKFQLQLISVVSHAIVYGIPSLLVAVISYIALT